MRRLAWALSAALALAGIATYVRSGDDWAWWTGLALVMPFAVLASRRAVKRSGRRGFESSGDGGIWGSP